MTHPSARRPLALVVRLLLPALAALAGAAAPALAQGVDPDAAAMTEAAQLREAGRHDEARAAFEAIAARFPDAPGPRFQLGLTALAADAPERAVPHFQAAAKTLRFRPVALYNLACAHARTNDAEAALGALGRAVDAGFGDVAAARADADLETIREDERFAAVLDRAGRPWPERLHFWVGEWDCYSARSGALSGRNTFSVRQDGTIIHEDWRAEGTGGAGQSWNCFDRGRGVWRQVWVDAGGGVLDFVGTPQGRGVLFEARRTDGLGRVERVRMFVRPVDGGRVRQTGTVSRDDGATWLPRYDLVYVPSGEAFTPAPAAAG